MTRLSAAELIKAVPAKQAKKNPPLKKNANGFKGNRQFAKVEATVESVSVYLTSNGITITGTKQDGDKTWLMLDRCPVVSGCESNGTDIAVVVSSEGIGYKNQHDRGQGLHWADVRDALEPGYKAWRDGYQNREATPQSAESDEDDSDDLIIRCASDVTTRPVEWFWQNKFVAGAINLLIGMPDVGKSVLTCDIAARKSTGTEWPPVDGERSPSNPGSVIFLAAEDSPETTLVPRLRAAGADLTKIHFIEGVKRDTQDGKVRDQFDIQRDIMHLRKMHSLIPDLSLVIIDPLDSYISAKTDTNIGNQARAALWPLKDWAEENGITIILVHHFNKSATTNAMDKVSGARSFGALPRSVWAVGRDPNDDDITIMAPIKLNLVKQSAKKAIGYEIRSALHDSDQPCVHWSDEAISLTAGDIIAGKQTQKCKAAEWLRDMLQAGPMPAKELKEHAEDAGHSWRTVEKAKDEANAISEQVYEGGKIIGWQWRLQ